MNGLRATSAAIACALLAAVAGCAKQQTDAETQADFAKAQAESARVVARVEGNAGEHMLGASVAVDKSER